MTSPPDKCWSVGRELFWDHRRSSALNFVSDHFLHVLGMGFSKVGNKWSEFIQFTSRVGNGHSGFGGGQGSRPAPCNGFGHESLEP